MNQSSNRFKKIVYNYDLVSGKVNQVSYQPGAYDAYYHRYEYDAENRLTDVYTGRDSVMLDFFPEREAHYNYYKHGPLAQTILGQLQVQKQDYAYTLQGWLKAINPTMGGTLTNGTDTTETFPVAQDAYGFSLQYFKNDYSAIGYTPQGTSVLGGLTTNAAPLFNGNIAAMAVNIPKLGDEKVYNYHYDQLNRIVAMDVYNGLNVNNGTFTPISVSDYKERISYDPNGNILTYTRNGDAARLSMDNLSYFYKSNTNQLHKVTDVAADAAPGDYSKYNDIKQGQGDNNYQYDDIGNLVSDNAEGITKVTWNVYGKISSLTKSGSLIKYVYDAAGNRIMKQTATDTTIYVRDASGNVMSVYSKPANGALVQSETHIYGSSRIGMATTHAALGASEPLSGGFTNGINRIFTRGEKLFELSNHLGNVLVTVTDKKIAVSAGGSIIDYYTADVSSANDYFPGGMQMPGRKFSTEKYRYSINGQEKSDEIAPNISTAQFWEYDSRIMRRWNIDPKQKIYESPYLCFSGNPVLLSDPLGDQPGDPPTKLYHNTPEGSNGRQIIIDGFNAAKNGKYSSYNWFMVTPEQASSGRSGTGMVTLEIEGVNLKNASIITNAQTEAWNQEALREMGYKDKNSFNRAQKTMSKEAYSKLYDEWRGRVNSKIGAYMDKAKQAAFYLERDGTYAVPDAVANSGTITRAAGSSAAVKALNGLKWGGRALIVVAVAKDMYDIYNSEDKARTVVTKAGGWTGAWVAGSTTAAALTATGIDFGGPWGWVAHGALTLGAGVGGYFAGEYITETVYDKIVTKGIKPGIK